MVISAALPTYATTIAGAMLPVLVAALGAFIKLYFRKLEKQWQLGHKQTLEGQAQLNERLAEAEALIRGDLKNGIKASLDNIDKKVTKVTERQGKTVKENSQK